MWMKPMLRFRCPMCGFDDFNHTPYNEIRHNQGKKWVLKVRCLRCPWRGNDKQLEVYQRD